MAKREKGEGGRGEGVGEEEGGRGDGVRYRNSCRQRKKLEENSRGRRQI